MDLLEKVISGTQTGTDMLKKVIRTRKWCPNWAGHAEKAHQNSEVVPKLELRYAEKVIRIVEVVPK